MSKHDSMAGLYLPPRPRGIRAQPQFAERRGGRDLPLPVSRPLNNRVSRFLRVPAITLAILAAWAIFHV